MLYILWMFDNFAVIVKATNGPRYVVGCRRQIDKTKLKAGTRVALDMTTLTIMRYLPREVDPLVYNMSMEDPGDINYSSIGGLSEQVRELREVGENNPIPSMFMRMFVIYLRNVLGYWAASHEPRALPACWHHSAQRLPTVRSTWNRKDASCACSCVTARCKLPQGKQNNVILFFINKLRCRRTVSWGFVECVLGGIECDRWQVHWWECALDSWDVWLRSRSRTLHHLHGRDRRYWSVIFCPNWRYHDVLYIFILSLCCSRWKTILRRNISWSRNPKNVDGGGRYSNESSINFSLNFPLLCGCFLL